jgi:hypothetical protein
MNISICGEDEEYIISAGVVIGVDDNYRELGVYKTEKRAKEILIEIATAYTNMEIINIPKIDIHEKITSQQIAKNICYQMPKE